jgi:hypothetical protein
VRASRLGGNLFRFIDALPPKPGEFLRYGRRNKEQVPASLASRHRHLSTAYSPIFIDWISGRRPALEFSELERDGLPEAEPNAPSRSRNRMMWCLRPKVRRQSP